MKTDQLKMLSRKQYEEWLKSFPPDYCSFCDWPHNQITLHEGKNWIWIANRSPYWYWHTMLVTKRHVREFDQLSVIEAGELVEMYGYIVKKYREAELKRSDNSLIKKYVFFWRLRDDLYDPISGNMRPDHFHIHIAPDKDHLWDPLLEKDAYLQDVVGKLGK